MLDGPAQWDGSTNAAGRRGPGQSAVGGPVSDRVVWETCPSCGDLAALVRGLDGEVAEFDCRGGCGLTDGQVGELQQCRRWEGS
jgi:hypothetical protein